MVDRRHVIEDLPRGPAEQPVVALHRPVEVADGERDLGDRVVQPGETGGRRRGHAAGPMQRTTWRASLPATNRWARAGGAGERLAAPDREVPEVALDRALAAGHDPDREPAVGDLDLVDHVEPGGVEEVSTSALNRRVSRRRAGLRRTSVGRLAGAGERRRRVGCAV